jgi:glycosyltransferase involved in cell wall biosynthesis
VKVVYVSSLTFGGPISHLLDLAPSIAKLGVEVKVVCFGKELASRFAELGVEAVSIPLRHKLDLPRAAAIWPQLAGADIVHSHDRRTGLLVRPEARMRRITAVHTLHGVPDELWVADESRGLMVPPGASRAQLAWLRHGVLRMEAALSHLGAVVVPSHALARYLVEHGFPASRLTVIPNGVELRRSRPGPAHDPVAIGTAAILEHRKGIDVLIEACARVETPVRLEVFGDGSLREELSEQARAAGIDHHFHGHVTDIRERLLDLDIFVLPTRAENLPIAILEAMACALPVISTRVGGISELVRENETGILVDPDDCPALAQALERLARDPDERERFGRKGAERIASHFSADEVARRMLCLYEELVGRA